MKKAFILCSLVFLLFSVSAQAKRYFVGEISATDIIHTMPKFKAHQHDVTYSEQQLSPLRKIQSNISFKVFFGQWCHDSQREVPRLINMFNQLNKPNFNVWYYGLNTQKSDPKQLAYEHKIKKTPTIIVYKDDKELGRILEFPSIDWPSDLSKLITKE